MADAVAWLEDLPTAGALALAGGKMGRLVELRHAGVAVPPGFAVTVDAYRRYCADSGLDERIDGVLALLPADPSASVVSGAAAEIRALVENSSLSDALTEAITAAYEQLCVRCLDVNVPTAVRSSATGEDAADASFAGIFDSYLGVCGPSRVLDAIRRCWASLFTSRAVSYRLRRGISHRDMPIAVGVTELIPARCAGVAFSVHPVTGKRDRIVIEASWGWGEAVVQGLVTPDHAEVGKSDGRLLTYDTARKTVVSAFDYSSGRVVETAMPRPLVSRRVLADEELDAIAGVVRKIEDHYGHPVDVEWVLERHRRAGDPVCVVQTRPVTAPVEPSTPTGWDPVAMATKYAFGGKGQQ